MSCTELQEEELEVLRSIYDGDQNFKESSATTMQYLVGEQGTPKSFLVEISWGENYPNEIPSFSLDAFYNKHISENVKSAIKEKLNAEASVQLGSAMTYTVVEWAKENIDELIFEIDVATTVDETASPIQVSDDIREQSPQASVKLKQPKLTKQQKRKLADKVDSRGELPRGWNWIDVVKHLSQTGSSND